MENQRKLFKKKKINKIYLLKKINKKSHILKTLNKKKR